MHDAVLDFLKLISDETRLKILLMILKKEMCVCEIIEELGLSQSLISHHLKLLRKNGFVRDLKEGKWVFYSANKKRLTEMLTLTNHLFADAIDRKEERAGHARDYAFCEHYDEKTKSCQTKIK